MLSAAGLSICLSCPSEGLTLLKYGPEAYFEESILYASHNVDISQILSFYTTFGEPMTWAPGGLSLDIWLHIMDIFAIIQLHLAKLMYFTILEFPNTYATLTKISNTC